MDKETEQHKKFLEDTVEWCRQQDDILKKIDEYLQEMKIIALSSLDEKMPDSERKKLNEHIKQLQLEVEFLQEQLNGTIH